MKTYTVTFANGTTTQVQGRNIKEAINDIVPIFINDVISITETKP